MPREKKVLIINNLEGFISKCSIGILTDYRGLSASEMTILRRQLRQSGIDYKVVKNTLARFAAEKLGRDDVGDLFVGSVAIAFGYGNIVESAQALDNYIRTSKTSLTIKGGFLAGRVLTSEEVLSLAKLPPKEVLLGKVLGGMQAPILSLLNCLTTPMRAIIGVLQARIQQLEVK